MTRIPRPPGPPGLPILGSALSYRRDPTGFLESTARRYGDIVHSRFAGMHLYLLSDPRHLEHVLIARRERYGKDRFLRSLAHVLGQGLLLSEGALWRTQRRRMAPAFAHRHVGQYTGTIVACAQDRVAQWRAGEIIDVGATMMRLTLDITLRALFGADDDDPARVGRAATLINEHFAAAIGNPLSPPRWVPTRRNRALARAIAELDEVVARILGARRAAPPRDAPRDLLDMLLAARDPDGAAMDDRQLRDELLTLLLAGHETTAQALTFALDLLARHPEVDAALADERAALPGPPGLDDLPRLPLHEQVALETLRLYPPAATIGREALADDEIDGYPIPRGSIVVMSQWVIHRDPRYYPDPTRFHPTRWTAEFRRGLPRLAYFPFGGGQRVCIGEALATLEARLALAVLLARHRLVPTTDAPIEVDVFWAYGIGAACACAAGTPLARTPAPLSSPYFTRTLLLLSLVWAPTGLLLLLRHPSWETMQVADSFADIPHFLVLAFGLTNITQGILGFWVAARLLATGRAWAAHLHWLLGYFGMFFILLYGWDGLGYDRFLYDRDMFGGAAWTPGAGLQPGAGPAFLVSTVARTLYLDGAYLLPFLLGTIGFWQRDEARRSRGPARSVLGWAGLHLVMIFGLALTAAALAALTVHAFAGMFADVPGGWALSYLVGLPLALAMQWILLFAPGRPLHRACARALGLPSAE